MWPSSTIRGNVATKASRLMEPPGTRSRPRRSANRRESRIRDSNRLGWNPASAAAKGEIQLSFELVGEREDRLGLADGRAGKFDGSARIARRPP